MTRVVVVRSGGVGGLIRRSELVTEELAEADAARWQQALGELEAIARGRPRGPSAAPDRFVWRVEYDDAAVTLGEDELTPGLRDLLAAAVEMPEEL